MLLGTLGRDHQNECSWVCVVAWHAALCTCSYSALRQLSTSLAMWSFFKADAELSSSMCLLTALQDSEHACAGATTNE